MSNEQRAKKLLRDGFAPVGVAEWRPKPGVHRDIAAALDEAEARGRAEALARVSRIADQWQRNADSDRLDEQAANREDVASYWRGSGQRWSDAAATLRALAADLSPAGTGRADTTGAEL